MPSHPTRASPRIFLSYARSDRDFAVALRDELEAAGLAVWHDLKDLEAGQWWSQIAGALEAKSIEHIVLIATPAALASQPVADEIWFAQREGKSACLVLPRHLGGTLGRSRLPRWLRAEEHFNFAEEGRKTALLDALAKPGQGPRRPRPEGRPKAADYVARAKEYGQIRAALLDTEGEATTATVVLTGPGGFGKTTLATAFINGEAVQQAYFNGILLVELGEGLAKLPKTYDGRKQLEGLIKVKVEALIKTLEGEAQVFDELDAAKVRLKEILDKRHGAVLLWIDDAWDAGHAQHFIDAAPDAAKLVTTRVRDLLPEAAARIDVDELTDAEAATFMGSELNPVSDPERTGLRELATITAGRWPILIRQINAQLRYQTADQANHKAQGLADAIASLRKRLKREGLEDLDKSRDANRATAVRLSVGVSFELLVEEDRHRKYPDGFHEARYLDLAGFQEAEVPVATIARLWAHLGVLRRAEAPTLDARDESKRADQEKHWRAELREESVAILERLYSLALLQKLDASDDDGMVRLHDVMRQYLADKQKEAIKAFHEQFVLAYDADTGETVSDMTERERRYFYTWFPTHLDKAGERAALDALLLDPQWMRRKLDALDSPLPLISDYERLGQGRVQSLIGRTLRLTSGILSRDGRQLLPQLLGRFKAAETAGIPNFIRNARTRIVAPAIVPVRCSLTSAGAETARLEGHCHTVSALQLLADGRLASASADGTIRLWNIEHQSEVARLAKYNQVTALATLKDGTLVYGCDDQGMFQIASNRSHGKLVATQISIAAGSVTALAVLPDGRIAAGNSKGEIWLCGSDGQIDFMLPKVHSELIFLLTALPDGRLVSASGEGPMQIWDVPLKQVV